MDNAEALIAAIESKYADLVRLYQHIPPAKLSEPSLSNAWSVKDLVAHIAAWEWRCAALLAAAHDTDAPLLAQPAVDALNREIYLERVNWAWAEVKYDAAQAHQSLLTVIDQFPAERLNREIVIATISQETLEHYSEHLAELQRWQLALLTATN